MPDLISGRGSERIQEMEGNPNSGSPLPQPAAPEETAATKGRLKEVDWSQWAPIVISGISLVVSACGLFVAMGARNAVRRSADAVTISAQAATRSANAAERTVNESESANKIAMDALASSKDATELARQAQEIARQQFASVNRPYLIITIEKFPDGRFVRETKISIGVQVTVRYKLHNVGNIAAKSIELPAKGAYSAGSNPVAYITPELLPLISLGPGAHSNLTMHIQFGGENVEDVAQWMAKLLGPGGTGAKLYFTAEYSHETEASLRYRSVIQYRFWAHEAHLLKSEVVRLNDEQESK